MPEKKIKIEDQDAIIEHRVDEIMDPKLPDPPQKADAATGAPDVPEIDIFKDTGATSPETDESGVDSDIPRQEDKKSPQEISQETDEKIASDSSIDDSATDPIVDEIVSNESDELLKAQDAVIAKAFDSKPPTFKERIRGFFSSWWQNKTARYLTFAVVGIAIVATAVIPGSRYFVLNSAGVRAGASLTILDSTTDLPLKNVAVTASGVTKKTNQDGVVRMKGLKLGTQEMTIQQLGFAEVTRTVTLGLGSNPLGEIELKAVGTQFTFKLTDYLSGKPVANAEAASGDANAQSDDKGVVILTVGKIDKPRIDVVLTAGAYRSEKISVDTTSKQTTNVVMVNKRKEVFISKQSGKYDVYKIDIDGKNKQLLLAGVGTEREQLTLVPHATDDIVALVSSRDNKRNQEGYLLDTLTLIDINDGSKLTLEHSERIQIVDWIDDKLVYVKVKAGTSAGNAERHQLMSYDYDSTARQQLAAANYFTNIVSTKGTIYYASTLYSSPGQPFFAKVNPDNTGKQNILNANIWSIIRTDYDNLYLAGQNGWYSYALGSKEAKKMVQQPSGANESRFYLDAPDRKRAIWTESRDGKGVLLSYDADKKKDSTLASQSGLSYPLRWLDGRTVVYRVVNSQETASYAISLDGGSPRKITDVTNASGLGKWYSW